MITPEELERLGTLRTDLFDAIAVILSRDSHSKSYEGTFRVQFPGYYDARTDARMDQPWGIFLDCYLIGPHRHYEWWGATFADVLQKAEKDIRQWMHEALEE